MIRPNGPEAEVMRAEIMALNGRFVEVSRLVADARHTALAYLNSPEGLGACRSLLAGDLREARGALDALIEEIEAP